MAVFSVLSKRAFIESFSSMWIIRMLGPTRRKNSSKPIPLSHSELSTICSWLVELQSCPNFESILSICSFSREALCIICISDIEFRSLVRNEGSPPAVTVPDPTRAVAGIPNRCVARSRQLRARKFPMCRESAVGSYPA